MTVIQELISEFEEIKKTKCKTLQEVIFFNGVLSIIEGKYLKKEQDKNKYSEEDLKEAFYQGWVLGGVGVSLLEAIDKWFEQSKNK
jgi:hypothetical protein